MPPTQLPSDTLVLLVRHAPVIPPRVLKRALEYAAAPQFTNKDSSHVLSALLSRPDVPLSLLEPLCARPSGLHLAAAVAYLNRPEHSELRIFEILDEDKRAGLRAGLLRRRNPNPLAARLVVDWVLAHPTSPGGVLGVLECAVKNTSLAYPARAQAVAHYLRVVATMDVDERAEEMDELHVMVGRWVQPEFANALAHTTAVGDLAMFLAIATTVDAPGSADLAAAALPHCFTGDLTGDVAVQLLRATEHLAKVASLPARTALANWWSHAVVVSRDANADAARVSARIGGAAARLCATTVADVRWLDVSTHIGADTGSYVELAAYLTDQFGTDDALWEAYLAISSGFSGTVGDLVATARAVTSGPIAPGPHP